MMFGRWRPATETETEIEVLEIENRELNAGPPLLQELANEREKIVRQYLVLCAGPGVVVAAPIDEVDELSLQVKLPFEER